MDNLFLGELLHKAIVTLVNRANLEDNERIQIAEFHPKWEQKSYGSNEYVNYNIASNGRAILWRSTRNVNASAPAPDQPANPVNWIKLGSAN